MRETKEVVVDNHTYTIGQFTPSKGLKILVRLSKIAGQPLAMMADSFKGKGMLDSDVNGELLGRAIQALTMNLDEATVEQTVKELLQGVLRDGKPLNFEIDFAQRYGHLFKVLGAVLEAQYGDFFGAIVAMRRGLGPSATAVPVGGTAATSNGSFGDASSVA